MTAICGGGTSSAKSGFGEFVYVAPAAIGALLNNIPTVWAVGLAGFIGSLTFRLATFCTTDPPAVPVFTAQDVADLLNPYNPFTYNTAQSKFQDLVGAYMWYQLCKCDSVATPAAPVPPNEPTGMPSINPPAVAPSYPTGQMCNSYSWAERSYVGSGVTSIDATLPVDGVTYVSIDLVDRNTDTDTGGYQSWYVQFLTSANAFISSRAVGVGNNPLVTHAEGAVPSNAAYMQFGRQRVGVIASPIIASAAVSLYCGTTPGGTTGTAPQPCPTDPFVLATLDQILALVTLIQRQAAPFAYIAGAAHAGLSGHGSFAVQGLLGARVEISDFGFNTGVEDGDPDELWHAGWVNWGNADGVSPRQYLTNAQMLTLPSLAGQYTEFHYSLAPGVVATVTELEREP